MQWFISEFNRFFFKEFSLTTHSFPTGHVDLRTYCFTVVCPWPSVRTQHIPVAPSVAVIIERHRFKVREVLQKFGIADVELAIGSFVLVALHFDLVFLWIVASSIASIV